MSSLLSKQAIAFLAVAVIGFGIFLPMRAFSQSAPAVTEPAKASLAEQIVTRQAEVTAELARVENQIAAAGDEAPESALREKELLDRIDLLLQQEHGALEQKEESEATVEQLKRDLEQVRTSGPSETAPYSILLLDAVREELRTLRGRMATIEAGVVAAAEAREQARDTLDKREAARRRATETKEGNSNESKSIELARQVRLSELESRAAAEALQLRKIEEERQRALRQVFETRITIATEREKWIASDSTFSQDDLRAKIVELQSKADQVRQQLEIQQSRIEFAERAWLEAKGRHSANTTNDAALAEEVSARRLAFQVHQRERALMTRRVERLVLMKEMWQRRFQIWRENPDRATISTWDADTRVLLDGFDTEHRLQELELRDLAKERVMLQSRLEGLGGEDAGVAQWVHPQIVLKASLGEASDLNLTSIESARRLAERMLDDMGTELATIGVGQRLSDLWKSVLTIWDFEITSIDDRSITVGKVVIGLVLLFLGFFLSKLISTWLGRRVLPRLGMNEGAAAAFRSISFYLLLIGFVFFALRTINVPLTAFTILGGAVAIGVGFGSQNIMNNFMSGLILIAERPVRVGDLIQIGELYGIVQHLGARSTRVLTGTNIEIVVPNSAFLENNVINWTLSESKVRIHVCVGVVYGSPTREVTRLLRKVVEEHGRVLKSPAPTVLFTEFADNSLNFEVHFWIVMRKIMDRRIIESDIRYRIDNLFNEASIVIAFPQRDVHLDTQRPLDIRVLSGRLPGEAQAEPSLATDGSESSGHTTS